MKLRLKRYFLSLELALLVRENQAKTKQAGSSRLLGVPKGMKRTSKVLRKFDLDITGFFRCQKGSKMLPKRRKHDPEGGNEALSMWG